MAEKTLKKVEDQLSCSICLDTYTNPKLLQCFHVFCQQCLVKLVVRDQQGQLILTCPICRHDTAVPASGVAGLQPAFQINHLLEIMEEHKKATADAPADAENEDEGSSSLTTSDCGINKICCREHDDRKVELYCETCGELICLKCGLKDGKHHSHEYEELGPAFEKYKVQVIQSMEPLEKQLATINKALADMKAQGVKTSSQGEAVETEVYAAFERIQQVLDARKAELVDQLHQITHGKLKKLASQRDKLETTQSQLTSCLGYMKESLETVHHEEVLSMKTSLVKQMSELRAKIPLKLLKPSAKTDLKFSASDNIITVCQNYGHMSTPDLTDPSKSYVAGKGIEIAEVGKVSTALLKTINFNCHSCSKPINSSEVELVSEITGTRTKGNMEKRDQGQYEISYQPTVKGRHQLHIRMEGQHVRGSPFSVSAKSPVEVLSAPITTIDQVRKPFGVAINQRGEAIVSEFIAHCVSVFSPEGDRLRPFGLMESVHFKYPRGVAVDDEGNVFVTDNRQVQKFTAEGDFLAAMGSEENGPYNGISVNTANKKVYVTSNKNNILVLNPNLFYASSFGKHGSGKGQFDGPHGVACDSMGRVYVSDSKNNRIQVFTAEGKFLKTFGTHRAGSGGELNHPRGIAMDASDMVYVSDERDCVSVFTSDGTFVTSFGSPGTQPGQFQGPFGVAVDRSGVVYVCDFVNFRVQLF